MPEALATVRSSFYPLPSRYCAHCAVLPPSFHLLDRHCVVFSVLLLLAVLNSCRLSESSPARFRGVERSARPNVAMAGRSQGSEKRSSGAKKFSCFRLPLSSGISLHSSPALGSALRAIRWHGLSGASTPAQLAVLQTTRRRGCQHVRTPSLRCRQATAMVMARAPQTSRMCRWTTASTKGAPERAIAAGREPLPESGVHASTAA